MIRLSVQKSVLAKGTLEVKVACFRRRMQQVEKSSNGARETLLFGVLQENFQHARHQEDLRERQNNVYWLIWGGVLTVVYANNRTPEEFPLLFLALAVISGVVLVSSLKWTVEFGNHIATVAAIARELKINDPTPSGVTESVFASPLPFGEFKGFMALPLKAPLYLNVGFWIASVQCFGFATAVSLAIFGFFSNETVAYLCGIIALAIGFGLCRMMFRLMKKQVTLRTAQTISQANSGNAPASTP